MSTIQLKDKSTLFSSEPGVRVMTYSQYTRATGVEKLMVRSKQTRSDTTDLVERMFSLDNGKSWGEPEPVEFIDRDDNATIRRGTRPGFVDPSNDRFVRMGIEARLVTDMPLEGLTNRHPFYEVSFDGGRSFPVSEQVILDGPYDATHPLRGVRIGWNSANIGDRTGRPLVMPDGTILVPFQIFPHGPDRKLHNPGGGHTYGHSALLMGRWDGDEIRWRMSDTVKIDPKQSTRGVIEPTIATLPGERILMVMRGSNDVAPELPGHKWYALSGDGGESWTYPEVWTYSDGTKFFSPSSCSQLVPHSSGRLFWIGNITPENPRGNRPRYPTVIGEVDLGSGLLHRDSVVVLEDRLPGEPEHLALSNFMAHEDRESGEILLHLSKLDPEAQDTWTSAAFLYRIGV